MGTLTREGGACSGPSPHPLEFPLKWTCHSSHPGLQRRWSKDLDPYCHHHRAAILPEAAKEDTLILPAQGSSQDVNVGLGTGPGCSRVGLPPASQTRHGDTWGVGYRDQSPLPTPPLGQAPGCRCSLIAAGSPAINRPAPARPASPLLIQPPGEERHQQAPKSMPRSPYLAGVTRRQTSLSEAGRAGRTMAKPPVCQLCPWGPEPQAATPVKRTGDTPCPPGEPQEWLGASGRLTGSAAWSLQVKSQWSQQQLTD